MSLDDAVGGVDERRSHENTNTTQTMTGHNRRAKYGSVLAVALTAVMVLSVFAAPAAAAAIGEIDTANATYTADEVEGDYTDFVEAEFNLNGTYNDGDNITVEIEDDGNEFDIEYAEVKSTDLKTEGLTGASTADLSDHKVNITLNLDSETDLSSTDDNVTVEFGVEVSDSAKDQAAKYSDKPIANVTASDGSNEDFVGQPAINATINPAEATKVSANSNADSINYEGGEATIDATIQDTYGNTVDDWEGELTYTLTDQVTESEWDTKSVDVTSDDNGVVGVVVNESGDDALKSGVGDFEVEVDNSSLEAGTDTLEVQPNTVDFSIAEDETDAGTPSTATLQLLNTSSEPIADENISTAPSKISLTEDPDDVLERPTLSNDSVDITDSDAEINSTYGAPTSTLTAHVESGSTTFEFNATTAGDYKLEASEVLSKDVGTSDTVKVLHVDADDIKLSTVGEDGDEMAYNGGSITADAQVVDKYENPVGQHAEGTNIDLKFTLETTNVDERSTQVYTTDIAGTTSITIANETGDIQPAVGADSIRAEVVDARDTNLNGDEVDSTSVTIKPDYVNFGFDGSPGDYTAGTNEAFTLQLNESSTNNIPEEDIDEFDTTFTLSTAPDDLENYQDPKIIASDGTELQFKGGEGAAIKVKTVSNVTTADLRVYATDGASNDEYQIKVEADEFDSSHSTNPKEFNSAEYDQLKISNVDNDLIGVVKQDGNSDVTVEVTDKYSNPVVEKVDVKLVDEDGTVVAESNEEATTNSGSASISITSLTSATTSTGEVTFNVSLNASADHYDTESIRLVHEAYDLNEGYQRMSLPQPAEVYSQNTNDITRYENVENDTGWTDVTEFYDAGVQDQDERLHSGLYVSGENSDARVGFDFVEDDEQTVSAGSAELKEGWNFVGTNYDISTETDVALADDLETVDDIDADRSSQEIVKTGDLSTTLDASAGGDNTSDLVDSVGSTDGEYGTYWVYIENPDDLTSNDRSLVGATYNPNDRSFPVE
ncbi:Uncharacterized protein HSRCO_0665 [Halanaeroarchaeum sp. HSR-CO]|uniref:hypothetical protein n=1 Tax=Halanaeroarchaeum sp. HSR-CO TaxID=2866382 RepID=UPI00217D0A07|nr:hypothetical protein [Halanaeroarchaeum sp. HSR-CO]UWG46960.1 Uncharacterized protein HSRCO_0665 [Halanaeroarchaeum sp. HSR-CO]